jgi:hypothetical protein
MKLGVFDMKLGVFDMELGVLGMKNCSFFDMKRAIFDIFDMKNAFLLVFFF